GAYWEDSAATGIDGDQGDNSAHTSGAAYVFARSGSSWSQQAYLKASNAGVADYFGRSVSVSGDTVVVGAYGEDSATTGIDGDQSDNSASSSGAAYVFSRGGGLWTQQAYLKASNTGTGDCFGGSVAVSGDTVVVGAQYEDSNATGVDGNQNDNSASHAGAAYVFERSGSNWSQQAYLKASNTGADDRFGYSVSLSGDTVVVGAYGEDSSVTGIDGDQGDNSAGDSGAAYVFDLGAPAQPELTVESPPGTELQNGGTGLDFGGVPAGGSSAPVSVAIHNTGTAELTGISLSVTGPDATDFSLEAAGLPAVLPVGGSASFTVIYTPATMGTSRATLRIASNDADENPFDLGLTGFRPPPNDHFGSRTNLGTTAGVVTGGTLISTTSESSSGEPDLSEFAGMGWIDDLTVWYEWTAPAGVEWARIHLAGPNVPTVLSVYTGSDLATLSGVALNRREIVSLPNRLTFPVTPGTTYQIRAAVEGFDFLPYLYGFPPPSEPAELDFTLGLSTIGTPVTAADYLMRGRGGLQLGTGAAMAQAEADFSSVLALDPDHDEARFLRAFTRLMLIESAPATDTLLADLDVTRSGTLRTGGEATVPTDDDGNWIPAVGSHSGMLFDWVDSEFLARLTALRAEFDLIQDDDFRTDLTQRETGEPEAYVDKGDVLVFKAVTHGVEMFFHLLFTYDLDVPFESIYNLKVLGSLSAQETLATFTSLLKFATSDRRPQFAAAMRAMEQDYLAATEFIRNRRADPTDLVTGDFDPDSPEQVELRDNLAAAVMSLDGEVTFNGTRVNLSRLMATSVSARDWLPDLRGDDVVPGTLPDPTLDGILPGMRGGEFDSGIYQMGRMWGMAQYAEELGEWLQWVTHQGDPGEDPDNDGRDNFAEWLAYTNALTSDTVWQELTHDVIAPGQKEVRLTFVRRKDLRDWKLRVAVSDDMATWDRTESQIEMVGTPVDNGDGFTETVTYRLKDASALSSRKFLKVEAVPK
ncbi:MAG: choice-of-anchor D domain-containing protein, partial [Akkermansiaceae bacterium]|nr:choice-of-anchor D domain-containing protein [Akkermansiaceae bacterium]